MSRNAFSTLRILAVAVALSTAGCLEEQFDRAGADAGKSADASLASTFSGAGVGGKCAATGDCRPGLQCKAGTCEAGKSTAANGKCLLDAECAAGLHCSWAGFCTSQPGGTLPAGQSCQKTADCAQGLFCAWESAEKCPAGQTCGTCKAPTATEVASEGEECTSSAGCAPGMSCELLGLSGVCRKATGKADVGATCKATSDCLSGLICSKGRGQCVPGSLLLNPDVFSGVECDDAGEAKLPFQALQSIPRTGVDQDFYAFPFPSDLRRKDGKLRLDGHPGPGAGLLGLDPVQGVVEAMAEEMDGYALSTAGYVRFTRRLDPATIKVVGSVAKEQATVRLVNLKTGADVVVGPKDVAFSAERNKYICANWLYVHSRWSDLLEPGATYALIVTDGVRQLCGNGACDKDSGETDASCSADCKNLGNTGKITGTAPTPSKDLQVLLSATAPKDATEKAAWDVHAPLRDFLQKNPAIKPAAATVFTTTDTRKRVAELAELALKANAPEFPIDGKPVVCAPNVASPCATPGWAQSEEGKKGKVDPRGCPKTVSPLYHEVHAKLSIPVYQLGDRPYLTTGGGLKLEGGKPGLVTYENVCMALTIPKSAMPAAGWPLVVFAHGTGGSFRSAADGGVAATLAKIAVDGGGTQFVATLAIDQPMHGPRRGKTADGKEVSTDPGPLFYNFANPRAAKGNFFQGAADNFALFRWAQAFKGAINGVGNVAFDKANLMFMGHSQGGTTGPMFLPYQAGLKGAVLSGCGGSLVYGLLGKKKPYDASIGLRIGLQDLDVDEHHPVLNLFQNYFEAADPLVYAPLMFHTPKGQPLTVLHTYGQGDSFTPPATSRIYAAASRGVLAVPDAVPQGFDKIEDLAMAQKKLPIVMDATARGVTVQALNDAKNSVSGKAYDGHFVAFNDKTIIRQVTQFVGTLIKGKPTVVK